jgi:cytochrome c-type biogenesis protein CcmH
MIRLFSSVLASALLALSLSAHAAVDLHQFDDPAQEARYKALIKELRCLVCQNQNLADSNAELAVDLRQQTYDMIQRGDSDAQIIEYMVARYGDFVLYRPPLKPETSILWLGPFVLMAIGITAVVVIMRRQRRKGAPEVSEAERERVRALLDEEQREGSGS